MFYFAFQLYFPYCVNCSFHFWYKQIICYQICLLTTKSSAQWNLPMRFCCSGCFSSSQTTQSFSWSKTQKMSPTLEVCVDNFESVKATVDGGGKRVELCSSLLVRLDHCQSLSLLLYFSLGWWTNTKHRLLETCQECVSISYCLCNDPSSRWGFLLQPRRIANHDFGRWSFEISWSWRFCFWMSHSRRISWQEGQLQSFR